MAEKDLQAKKATIETVSGAKEDLLNCMCHPNPPAGCKPCSNVLRLPPTSTSFLQEKEKLQATGTALIELSKKLKEREKKISHDVSTSTRHTEMISHSFITTLSNTSCIHHSLVGYM